jgi:hypothetical protein
MVSITVLSVDWQPEADAGAMVLAREGGVDLDLPTVFGDDAIDQWQPQPGTLSGRLGGDEWLEEMITDAGIDASPVIDHADD